MNQVQISKFLSLVLRHKPDVVGIKLDDAGWVDVDTLLDACHKYGRTISVDELHSVVEKNDKRRFVIREGRIRANQGHSVDVQLGLQRMRPPQLLFHGTVAKYEASIQKDGLKRMNRQHVHLSSDVQTATVVGRRRGEPVIYEVKSGEMFQAGYDFFLSENGVWLTESVPPQFLSHRAIC